MAGATAAAGLTDTDVLIDAIKRLPGALAFIAGQQQAHGLTVSIVSAMELIRGCRNAAELAHLQQFLGAVTIPPLSPQASRTTYTLMEAFSLSHGLQIPDALRTQGREHRGSAPCAGSGAKENRGTSLPP